MDMDKFFNDHDLHQKALKGDRDATQMYCGSYTLVKNIATRELYRCKGDVPIGYVKVAGNHYDKDGFLFDIYWSLPRI